MNGITSITLRRGGCLGTCPVYSITLNRDGNAFWVGEYFVDRTGRYRGEVDEWTVSRLGAEIERVRFFSWDDRYEEQITDHPTYELEVVRDGQAKHVVQYATDEPLDFWTIATLIDGIASQIEWIREEHLEL